MREADRLILARFAPPGVLINEAMEILQFRGNIENYLTPAPGEASLNLLRMAREGLLFEVRSAIQKALKTGSSVIRNDISVWVQNAFRAIGVEVIPLRPNGNGERFLLVLFHGAPTPELPAKPNKSNDKKAAPKEIEKPAISRNSKPRMSTCNP